MVVNRLIDGLGRRIDHLRLSVTEVCDLRCSYCRPAGRVAASQGSVALSNGQRVSLVRFLSDRYGLRQVRITGGEPLVLRDVVDLVAGIRQAVPDVTIAMTTNGQRLYHAAFELRQAGLDRLNVSLDSLDSETYRTLTGGDIDSVLRGLESATFVGFPPPKINMVVLRGINDGDVGAVARWGMQRGSEVRFLEVMEIGPTSSFNRGAFVSSTETIEVLQSQFNLRPLSRMPGETAIRYAADGDGLRGVIGTISPVSDPFCGSCRRMRLSSDGRLFPCLLDGFSVSLREALSESEASQDALNRLIVGAVRRKKPAGSTQTTPMIELGG